MPDWLCTTREEDGMAAVTPVRAIDYAALNQLWDEISAHSRTVGTGLWRSYLPGFDGPSGVGLRPLPRRPGQGSLCRGRHLRAGDQGC